jgi:hypothetical protein
MKLTNEEKNLTAHILDMYVDTLIEITDGQPPSAKVMICVEELETIKSVLLKILHDEPETITGVITGFKQLETKDECVQFIKKYLEQNTLCTLDYSNFNNVIEILQKKEETITGVITGFKEQTNKIKGLIENNKTILDKPEFIELMKQYGITKNK